MTEDQFTEHLTLINMLKVTGMAFIPVHGGPFDGTLQHLPCISPDGMFLKKAQFTEGELASVQSIYKLVGLMLIYQGDERI